MKRRWAGLLLLLALAGQPVTPLVASLRSGCARCAGAARCCCAPARGPGGCGLARPCGSASGGEGVTAPQGPEKALPESTIVARVSPAPPRIVQADPPFEAADPPPVPPDPPPRTSLQFRSIVTL
jgi:hypothetical protein